MGAARRWQQKLCYSPSRVEVLLVVVVPHSSKFLLWQDGVSPQGAILELDFEMGG